MSIRIYSPRLVVLVALLTAGAQAAQAVDTLYDQRFREWTERAQGGDPEAQYDLGNAYLRGTEVARDLDKAVEWFAKAAQQDHAKAEYKLGYLYYTGEGVRRSYSRARRWLGKSARQGYSPAQFYLGLIYAEGKGVDRDYHEALRWFEKAAADEYGPAKEEIAKVRAAIAEEKARREAEREKQRRAETQQAARRKPAPKPEPKPEPQPASRAKPEPEPGPLYAKTLLLEGQFVTEAGQPAQYMPSSLNRCQVAGDEIICMTQQMTRSTDAAKITYEVKTTVSDFTPEGRFVVRYRRNNVFVLPVNPDDPAPKDESTLPPTGWEKVRTTLKCRFAGKDAVHCINDDFQRENFSRE